MIKSQIYSKATNLIFTIATEMVSFFQNIIESKVELISTYDIILINKMEGTNC